MTAVREQILAAVETRLQGLAAEVERMPSADPISFPALHIFDGGQAAEGSDVLASRFTLDLEIVGYVDGAGGATTHAAANALYAAVVAALMTGPPLGGLAEAIEEGDLRLTTAPLTETRCIAFSLDLSITFANRRDDPAQPA